MSIARLVNPSFLGRRFSWDVSISVDLADPPLVASRSIGNLIGYTENEFEAVTILVDSQGDEIARFSG